MTMEALKPQASISFRAEETTENIVNRIWHKLVPTDDNTDLKAVITQIVTSAEPGTIVEIPRELLAEINKHNYEQAVSIELKRFQSALIIELELAQKECEQLQDEIGRLEQDAIYSGDSELLKNRAIQIRAAKIEKIENITKTLAIELKSVDEKVTFLKSRGKKIIPPREINCYSFEIEPKQVIEPIVTIGPIDVPQTLEPTKEVPVDKLKRLTIRMIPYAVASMVFAVLATKMTDDEPQEQAEVLVEDDSTEISSFAEFQKLQELFNSDPELRRALEILAYQMPVLESTPSIHPITFSSRGLPKDIIIPSPYTNIVDWHMFNYSIVQFSNDQLQFNIWLYGQRDNSISLVVPTRRGL